MKKIQIVLKRQNDKSEIYEEVVEFDANINQLDLSDRNLIEIPIGLEQFNNLIFLHLEQNQISKIKFLTKNGQILNKKYLQSNQITKIENIGNFINLKELYLDNNKISRIENLDNLINLQILYLINNQISKIENIHHLNKLKHFYLFSTKPENVIESFKISFFNEHFKEIHQQLKQQFNNSCNDILVI